MWLAPLKAWSRLVANATFSGLRAHGGTAPVWPTFAAKSGSLAALVQIGGIIVQKGGFPGCFVQFGMWCCEESEKRLGKTSFNVFTSGSLQPSLMTTCSIYPHVSCKSCKLQQSRPRGKVQHSHYLPSKILHPKHAPCDFDLSKIHHVSNLEGMVCNGLWPWRMALEMHWRDLFHEYTVLKQWSFCALQLWKRSHSKHKKHHSHWFVLCLVSDF